METRNRITVAIATNNYSTIYNDYINNTNDTKNNISNVKDNIAPANLHDPNTTPLDGILILHNNRTSNNKLVTEKCLKDTDSGRDCKQELNKRKLSENNDTILKYLYKKTEKANLGNKTKGHSKNSISRKKRSEMGREPTFYKNVSPPPYTTPRIGERESFVTLKDENDALLTKSKLANFKVKSPETSRKEHYKEFHADLEDSKHSRPIKSDKRNYEQQQQLQHHDTINRNDKGEKNTYKSTERDSSESDESKEKTYGEAHNTPPSGKIQNYANSNDFSKEAIIEHRNRDSDKAINHFKNVHKENLSKNKYQHNEDSYRTKLPYENNKSIENSNESTLFKKQNYANGNKFSKDALTDHRTKENDQAINHSKNAHKENLSKNNYKHNIDLYRTKLPYEDSKSVENSEESTLFKNPVADIVETNYKKNSDITITPRSLQDVDLDNFSYERIQLNNKGQVEPVKDLREDYNSAEITHTTAALSKLNKDKAPLSSNINPSESLIISSHKPVHITDREVKPVVELNNENDNTQSSEEKQNKYQIRPLENAQKYDSSTEEDLLNKAENEKISSFNGNSEKANVKQQFERIPLDYNHDDKSQKDSESLNKPGNTKDNSDENINDGTLDALTPKTDRFDENLKIKFGDVSITLPEIKLPNDILSYARIGAPKESERTYPFDDEDSDETREQHRKGEYDTDKTHDYYSTYNNDKIKDHENYKKPNIEHELDEDDDEVDLYEKFVKERFGKESSLGKRSDKLQASENRPNSKLLETVQKILKKTEKVKDEAEKSGDPNAGYMWTLEYGEDL